VLSPEYECWEFFVVGKKRDSIQFDTWIQKKESQLCFALLYYMGMPQALKIYDMSDFFRLVVVATWGLCPIQSLKNAWKPPAYFERCPPFLLSLNMGVNMRIWRMF